ncbi:hypothetical protein GCM10009834_45680 [Streptomonospora arabica]
MHVIVYPNGLPVEIQVRTRWQHEWAEMFEKLADLVGRDIRYGYPPRHWWHEIERSADLTPEQEYHLDRVYDAAYAYRESLVELALAISDLIAGLENEESQNESEPEEIQSLWLTVHNDLADLREAIREMEPFSDS